MVEDSTGEAFSKRMAVALKESVDKDIETMKAAGCKIHDLSDAEIATFRDPILDIDSEFWSRQLQRAGVKDPMAWFKEVRDFQSSLQ